MAARMEDQSVLTNATFALLILTRFAPRHYLSPCE